MDQYQLNSLTMNESRIIDLDIHPATMDDLRKVDPNPILTAIFEAYSCDGIICNGRAYSRDDCSAGSRTRVAMMQPHFLPWLGYFELIARADIFVILDDFQFSRQSWGHRNRLFLAPGVLNFVTLPIKHPSTQLATFNDVQPLVNPRWIRKLEASLRQVYGRMNPAPGVIDRIIFLLGQEYTSLAELEISVIRTFSNWLGLNATIVRSSELSLPGGLSRSERLISIIENVGGQVYYAANGSRNYMIEDGVFPVQNIDVYFQDHTSVPYAQHGVEQFMPRLSALDAFLRLPPAEVAKLLPGTARWISWDDAFKITADNAGQPEQVVWQDDGDHL